MSVPVTVMSATWPDSTWVMNSLNFSGLSFFWIWAKCQARKMTTSSDIHNMTVLNVAFTVSALQGLPKHESDPHYDPSERVMVRPTTGGPGRGMVPMYGNPR